MKKVAIFFAIFFLFLATPVAHASENKIAGESARVLAIADNAVLIKTDTRVQTIRLFLSRYNSPLMDSSETFVKEADANGIDWKLVVAISGVESTFGHALPYNSNNAWGWGIYGTTTTSFNSYDEGIQIISKALAEKYIKKLGTDDVYVIGKMYASSPTWGQKVEYFMNKISAFQSESALTNSPLALSLSL